MGICFLQSILLQRYELASISCILRDNFKLKELALPASIIGFHVSFPNQIDNNQPLIIIIEWMNQSQV